MPDENYFTFLPLAVFMTINSTAGCIGNFIMVVATIRTSRFRMPCHILIGLSCFADMIHQSGQFPYCYQFFADEFSTQERCFWILLVPLLGANLGGPIHLSLGIDRLLAIKFPLKYRHLQYVHCYYVMALLAFPCAFTATVLSLAFVNRDPNMNTTCAIPLGMNGISMQVFTYGSYAIYIPVIFVYLFAFYLLNKSSTSKKFRSVYISIFVTVMFVVCGWLTTTLTNTFSYALSPDPFVQMVIQIYAGIAVNFGMTCNIFIFYTINHEYRIAIKNLFGWIRQTRQLEMSTSTVQPISSGMNTKGSRDRRKSSRMSTTTTGSVANLEQRKMAWID